MGEPWLIGLLEEKIEVEHFECKSMLSLTTSTIKFDRAEQPLNLKNGKFPFTVQCILLV